MLSTTLHEAAVAFGLGLRQAPALAAYRAADAVLDADPIAQQLLADLRRQQIDLSRLERSGLAPSQAQIDRLRLCQAAARGNATIMDHLQATNDAKAFLPVVAAQVSAALGTDFANLVAPVGC